MVLFSNCSWVSYSFTRELHLGSLFLISKLYGYHTIVLDCKSNPAWIFTLYKWFLTSWRLEHSSSLKLRHFTEVVYAKYSKSVFPGVQSFLSASIHSFVKNFSYISEHHSFAGSWYWYLETPNILFIFAFHIMKYFICWYLGPVFFSNMTFQFWLSTWLSSYR